MRLSGIIFDSGPRIFYLGRVILLTGFCGPNAFETLTAAGVKVVSDQNGQIIDALQKNKQGGAVYAEDANKEGHW